MVLVPADLNALLQLFLTQAPAWVRAQRALHRPSGRGLTSVEIRLLAPFFESDLLDSARLVDVPSVTNPPFYAPLIAAGIQVPLDFTEVSGITFDDTILLSQRRPVEAVNHQRLIFHELVHVAQFRAAGIDGFVSRYVIGWATNGFAYEKIPLEVQAYDLDARFASNPGSHFSVQAEVGKLIGSTE